MIEEKDGKTKTRGIGLSEGKIAVSELEGVEYEKGCSHARQRNGGQRRTHGGMLGMGKSRETVTGDGVEKTSSGKM